jgi:hypothetical protein
MLRVGFTSAVTTPVLSNVTSVPAVQAEPSGDETRRGVPRKRTSPLRRAVEPYATVPVVGRSRRSTPTVIHVERRPSPVRSSEAGTVCGPAVVWISSERRRPDGVAAPVASITRALAASLA